MTVAEHIARAEEWARTAEQAVEQDQDAFAAQSASMARMHVSLASVLMAQAAALE